jgi:hypothetical protein
MKRCTPVRIRLIVSVILAAGSVHAANQWFDTGAAANVQGGIANWDTGVPAWSMTSAGTTVPVAWTNGNNAFFTSGASTAVVNNVTAGWLVLGAGNPYYFQAGTGPLTLNNGLTVVNSVVTPHGGNGGGSAWLNTDIVLGADQDWHISNYTLAPVTNRISGPYTFGKCGYTAMSLSNSANAFAALAVRSGPLNAYSGGTVLGLGHVTIGAPLPADESPINFGAGLNPCGLNVVGNPAGITTTVISNLIVNTSGFLTLTAAGTGTNILQAEALVRNGRARLGVNGGNKWGAQNRLTFTSGTDLTNGMLPPWIADTFNAGADFLTYGPNGITTAVYSASFSPTQIVNLSSFTTLTSSKTSYAARLYYMTLNLNGFNLNLGDGTYAGLALAGNPLLITNGVGAAGIDSGAAEFCIIANGNSILGVPLPGTGPMTVFGQANGQLVISNSALYAAPITVWGPSRLNLSPTLDATLASPITLGAGAGLTKGGPNTLTLAGTTNFFDLAAGITVSGGKLVLDGVLATNKGALAVSGPAATMVLTNNTQMPGLLAVSVSGRDNLLEVVDSTLGTAPNNRAWSIGGVSNLGNTLTLKRSQLASGAFTIGSGTSNNTVRMDGPGAVWNFGGGAILIGNPPATGNVMTVDGGGVAGGAILTNISTLGVGQGGNSSAMSGNRLELSDGASLFMSGNLSVGSGNNSSVTSNNTFLVNGGAAGCVIRTPGTIGMGGGGNSNAFCGGNTIIMANAAVWSVGSGIAGPNNTWLVQSGSVWDLGGGANSLGGGGVSNAMIINGGIVTNVGRFLFSGQTNTFILSNGAQLINTGSGNANEFGTATHGGTLSVLSGSLFLYVRALDFGTAGGKGNTFLIDNATVTNPVGAALAVGGLGAINLTSFGNTLVITNRGRLFSNGGVTLGSAGSYSGAACFNNSILLADSGSLWDNGGNSVTIGNGVVSSNNTLVVRDGARLMRVNALTIGSSATNNAVVVLNGAVVEVASLTVGASVPDLPNTFACTNGVLQFTTATPTVTRGAAGSLTLTDGSLSFRGVANANVKGNWTTTLTNITLAGANAFRLDTATNNNAVSQSYWFGTDRGLTNYAGLELFNGGTAYTNGSVAIGTNGWLTFSNTQATMWGPVTNYGVMSIFDSTVTFKSNLVLAEGSTLVWSTNNAANAVTVLGTLSLPAALTVYAPVTVPKGETLTLFNAPGGITGSTADWTVIPDSYRVEKTGNTLVLTRKTTGTLIMVR